MLFRRLAYFPAPKANVSRVNPIAASPFIVAWDDVRSKIPTHPTNPDDKKEAAYYKAHTVGLVFKNVRYGVFSQAMKKFVLVGSVDIEVTSLGGGGAKDVAGFARTLGPVILPNGTTYPAGTSVPLVD